SANRADQTVALRLRAHAHSWKAAEHERLILVGDRMLALHPPGERVQRLLGGVARDAGAQRARQVNRIVAAVGEAARALLEHLVDDRVEAAEREPPFGRE